MAVAKVGDINIYYEIHGKGEPLVLIMGITFHSGLWFRTIPAFSSSYQVITFDNRGCGRSDKPNPPYTMEMMSGDIAGLLNTIGIESAHVFGISMGGGIAQYLALNYPQKIKSLILGGTSCGGSHSILPNPEAMAWLFDMELRQKQTPEERAKEMLPFMYSVEFIKNNLGLLQQMGAISMQYAAPIQGVMGQAAALKNVNTYERLPEVKAPTLVLAGNADRLCPVENSRILASRIPNCELVILKNAGHGFNIEAEEETNRIILDFLRRHGDNHQV